VPAMADAATYMRTVLEALGPTNRIAHALVFRLQMAEDPMAEAEAISDELDDIWEVISRLTGRVAEVLEAAIDELEGEANRP
jgi:hypothetical protein